MKEKLKKIIIPIIIFLTEVFIYFQMTLSKPELTLKYKLVYLILCVLSNISAIVICKYLNKNKKLKIENIFLLITIIYGGLYLIFVPAILGTDELPHFLRP